MTGDDVTEQTYNPIPPKATYSLPIKQQLFFAVFQDDSLKITNVASDPSYDKLWQKATDEAKTYGGFWTIFNSNGKYVDGNIVSR